MDHSQHGGMFVPVDEPTWTRVFFVHLDGTSWVAIASIVATVLYLVGVIRLRSTGVSWPWWRTLSWVSGTASIFVVTGTWLNGYSMVLFSLHMVQHMVLAMITPILLLLGSPVTLLLRTLPRGRGVAGTPRALLLNVLHSRFGRFMSHAGFTVPLFIASLYGIYFTPIFDWLMSSVAGHQFMLAHFIVTGVLFFGPVMAQDPWPQKHGHAARILELLVPVPFHAFFGVAVMIASTLLVETFANPPAAWRIDPVGDQTVAGGVAWSFGELPTVLVVIVVLISWASSDERQARAMDRKAERTGNAELHAYNAKLRALAERDRERV